LEYRNLEYRNPEDDKSRRDDQSHVTRPMFPTWENTPIVELVVEAENALRAMSNSL
jgi:hypothetical protein